jgi:hypothetical protein
MISRLLSLFTLLRYSSLRGKKKTKKRLQILKGDGGIMFFSRVEGRRGWCVASPCSGVRRTTFWPGA